MSGTDSKVFGAFGKGCEAGVFVGLRFLPDESWDLELFSSSLGSFPSGSSSSSPSSFSCFGFVTVSFFWDFLGGIMDGLNKTRSIRSQRNESNAKSQHFWSSFSVFTMMSRTQLVRTSRVQGHGVSLDENFIPHMGIQRLQ